MFSRTNFKFMLKILRHYRFMCFKALHYNLILSILQRKAHLLVESELLLIAVTMVRLLALLPGDGGTYNGARNGHLTANIMYLKINTTQWLKQKCCCYSDILALQY